jgi:hypothetical protein
MSKSSPMAFQPAPRPQPRTSPEQARELADATRDLGFSRTTSPPEAEPSAQPAPTSPAKAEHAVAEPAPAPAPRAKRATGGKAPAPAEKPAAAAPSAKMATLKVAMADETWDTLRLEAIKRRVTVKYLVMEALAEKGYDIDLTKVAEDGRRIR